MKTNQQNFWRGFTWQRFIKHFLILLVLMYAFDISSAWISKERITDLFITKYVIKRVTVSLILGFFIAVWYEPDLYKRKEEKTKA